MSRLIFVHGRAQQGNDADFLKQQWIGAWRKGLEKSHLPMPLAEKDIKFPFYGETLDGLVRHLPDDQVADVIVKGTRDDDAAERFLTAVVRETAAKLGITDQQVRDAAGADVIARGIENWEWVQSALKVIDGVVPGGSGAAIAIATNDVHQYLHNPGIRDVIETGVRKAFVPGEPTVLVSHSLGTVVSYALLKREGQAAGWDIKLFVTLGSPLAVKAIRTGLSPLRYPPAAAWFNAMDEADVVSLYPLDKQHFDVDPAVENKTDVENWTPNHHGIVGYLDDAVVAKRIHDALV